MAQGPNPQIDSRPMQVVVLADPAGNLIGTGVTASVTGVQVQGNTGAATTDFGNPVKVGGVYNAGGVSYTNGQRGDLQFDSVGNVRVNPGELAASTDSVAVFGAANQANAQLAPTNVAATAVGTHTTRNSVTFFNSGTVTVYLGVPTVTTATGVQLLPGSSRTFTYQGLIQMITAANTGAVDSWDEWS